MTTIAPAEVQRLQSALPFWMSLGVVPVAVLACLAGGWTILLIPAYGWMLTMVLDALTGLNPDNADPATPESGLIWYRLITLIWFPLQFALMIWMLAIVPQSDQLDLAEKLGLFFGLGVITGTVGINYAHELSHQKPPVERLLADLLLASVLYSHFRSEHLRVHHHFVGTPADPVTARYNEGFYRFFPRVLIGCFVSALDAEAAILRRRGLPVWHLSNPFWRYGVLQAAMLALAFGLGGWLGVGLFLVQAFVAVWQLELVNYVEHYGLTRRHLGNGKYEHVLPRHSWNASHRASNWLLINLQRHSDHHHRPHRRFALLQTHDQSAAPQLPRGYPLMTLAAMVPPIWRRMMNPKVREWRRTHYPDITDWKPYNKALNPMPQGAVR